MDQYASYGQSMTNSALTSASAVPGFKDPYATSTATSAVPGYKDPYAAAVPQTSAGSTIQYDQYGQPYTAPAAAQTASASAYNPYAQQTQAAQQEAQRKALMLEQQQKQLEAQRELQRQEQAKKQQVEEAQRQVAYASLSARCVGVCLIRHRTGGRGSVTSRILPCKR